MLTHRIAITITLFLFYTSMQAALEATTHGNTIPITKQEHTAISAPTSRCIVYNVVNTLLSFQAGFFSGYQAEIKMIANTYESPAIRSTIFYSCSLLSFPVEYLKSYLIGKRLLGVSKEQRKHVQNTGTIAHIMGLSLGGIIAKFLSIPRLRLVIPNTIPPRRPRSAAEYNPEFEDDTFPAITDRA